MAESDTFQLLKRQISRSHVLYAPYTLLTPHNWQHECTQITELAKHKLWMVLYALLTQLMYIFVYNPNQY